MRPTKDTFRLPSDVPVSSFFIDESGSKNSTGGFFVLGFVKARGTPVLARAVRDLRQRHGYYAEAKFGGISKKNAPFYFDLVEMLAEADVRVGRSVYDSRSHFGDSEPTWVVQARMAGQLVLGNANRGELLNVFLDLVQTPRGESVAKRVEEKVNGTLGTRSVIAAYDLDSQSTDLLQLADVVAGSIAYERRQLEGDAPMSTESPKARVSTRLKRALRLESFADVRAGKVNILTMRSEPKPLPGLEF